MEAFLGDTEEGTDDSPERKKSKLKILKTRLFGKSKKAGETSSRKLSQSASDITADKELESNEDLLCSQGVMGSRAFSHDSIFLADQLTLTTESEPARVLSQENVHSKIKALQEKLQQQKFHLGQPPMIPPIITPNKQDETSPSEEDVHPSETTEKHTTMQDNLNKVLSQMSVNPVLPIPSLNKPAAPKLKSPIDEAPLDFSTPAQFTPSLDTSAARHRLSIKPRNQRASSKKRHTTDDTIAAISTLNNSETLKEEDGEPDIRDESEKQIVDSKPIERTTVLPEPKNPESTSKTPGIESSQQDIAFLGKMPTVTTQILRPKSHRPTDVMPRPHSSFIPSEVKGKSESSGNFDIQFLRDTQNKTWAADMKTKIASTDPKSASPGLALRSTVVLDETGRTAVIKRPLPGSGSFHLSASASKRKEEEDRPRSGSFTGVREHWIKTGKKQLDTSSSNISPKVDSKPCGAPLNLGREERLAIKDNLRKVDSAIQSKNKATDTEDAETVKEGEGGEGKTTFGIKLRSTSQSVRLRAEVASNECSKSETTVVNKQDINDNADQILKKTTCTTEEPTPDVSTAPSAAIVPTKQTVTHPLSSAEAQSSQVKGVLQAPVGPQPHATSTEVSWMSMAMEKTKSLQNLFTNKFPRDLTGGQTATHLQKTQGQTFNRAHPDTQTHYAKSSNQPLTDAAKTEVQQYKTPAQTIKQSPSSNTAQQNTLKASLFKEAQIKPTLPTSSESVTQSVTQGNMWTTQSPLRSVRQVENASLSSPHNTSRQPPWSTRSLKSTSQAVTPSSQDNTAECTVSAANMEETDEQPVWGRSVGKKAAFLEKRAEWTSAPVEVKKKETPTLSEPLAQSKETEANVDSETKHRDSAPLKIPERPTDKKWLCKTPDSRSAPSPSSTPSSSLQSLSDSGELSWIELAKRKSMAWSDKTMD